MDMEISDHGQNDHWCLFELSISALIMLVYISLKWHPYLPCLFYSLHFSYRWWISGRSWWWLQPLVTSTSSDIPFIELLLSRPFKWHPYWPPYSTHCILVIDGGFQEGVDEDDGHWWLPLPQPFLSLNYYCQDHSNDTHIAHVASICKTNIVSRRT